MRSVMLAAGVLFVTAISPTARAGSIPRYIRPWQIACRPGTNRFCLTPPPHASRSQQIGPSPNLSRLGQYTARTAAGTNDLRLNLDQGFDPAGNADHFAAPDHASGTWDSTQNNAFKDFSPGQSTAFGQHVVEWTLLTAPLAAYALSPVLDHKLHYMNNGMWQRQRQLDFEYAVIAGEIGGSLWFGGQSRLGKTFWRSMDASFYTAVTVQAMKYAFSRARPSQSDSPDHWFQGNCCQSFPSGEVSFQASAVTPFIAEYYKQYPWIWALEALPAYDALARMKAHGHWQTDVLAAWAIGTAWGLYAHFEPKPLILSIMPHGILVGIHVHF